MRVLVVDDNPILASTLGRWVRSFGHETLLARGPEEALTLLDKNVDAVISDIEMPVMSGLDLARVIRQRHADMPIAFCSGSEPDGDTRTALGEIGPFLTKPWLPEDLAQVLVLLGGQVSIRLAS
ncbi:MAG: response regulator [Pseudomonadota bacterium]